MSNDPSEVPMFLLDVSVGRPQGLISQGHKAQVWEGVTLRRARASAAAWVAAAAASAEPRPRLLLCSAAAGVAFPADSLGNLER